jgi:hypothetical protein
MIVSPFDSALDHILESNLFSDWSSLRLPSHSHRGFSPVWRQLLIKIRNHFKGFFFR